MTLDILDSSGHVVRHFSSAEPLNPAKLDVPAWWPRPPMNLSTRAGMHRFVWDMHYPPVRGAPQFLDANQAVRHNTPVAASSPWIMPGRYTVRLTVDGQRYTQPLTVKMDPRVHTSRAALQEQFDASMQTYRESLAASAALGRIRDLERQIVARTPSAALASYREQLEALSGPETTSRYAFLFHRGAPTAAEMKALRQIGSQYTGLMRRWASLKSRSATGPRA